jgi:hypothetical protein
MSDTKERTQRERITTRIDPSALEVIERLAEQCPNAVELSNNIIQKGLAFGRDWSGTVVNPERTRAPRSCPAGSLAEVGLGWCGTTPLSTETEDFDVKVCEEAISPTSTHGNDCCKAVVAGNGQFPSAA